MLNAHKKAEIQQNLLAFTRKNLSAFLDEHPQETFYAFAYDCNLEYGQVNLCLNSEAAFRQNLAALQNAYPESCNDEKSMHEFRYNTGNWGYLAFATHHVLSEDELAQASARLDQGDWQSWLAFVEELRQLCRDTLKLFVQTAEYQRIPKTPDFTIYAIDHEESVADALQQAIKHK